MVRLTVKLGDQVLFLHDCTVDVPVQKLIEDLVQIQNGRLKIERVGYEIEELSKHGTTLPTNMQGLTEEQVEELKLVDEWAEKCSPGGGFVQKSDPLGRRNGRAPTEKMAEVLTKTVTEARSLVSKNQAQSGVCVTEQMVRDALDMVKGAVMIVYPMQLPPHDPIRAELENREDLSGMQASLEVLDVKDTSLWWAGKEMHFEKLLQDHIGKNEKTKVVVKIQKKGQGAPARESVISEEEQKQMMAFYYRKQEELKKLESDDSSAHLNSSWADGGQLKRQFQGLNNIKWGPR